MFTYIYIVIISEYLNATKVIGTQDSQVACTQWTHEHQIGHMIKSNQISEILANLKPAQ